MAQEAYEETLEVLSESVDTFASAFESLGLDCLRMNSEELLDRAYKTLNPKRSDANPAPKIISNKDTEIDAAIPEDAEWLANSSPREQIVFGDLVLNFDQFILDGQSHKVVTLKTLPEVTFAGQMAKFLKLPFHYTMILSFNVPPQASEMAKLQQKRKMAHSMALTSGNRASDLESEIKLNSTEELIRSRREWVRPCSRREWRELDRGFYEGKPGSGPLSGYSQKGAQLGSNLNHKHGSLIRTFNGQRK